METVDTSAYPAVAARVLAEVLERQAFMFADPPAEGAPPPRPKGVCLKASMSFHGPKSGSVTLCAPVSVCESLAVNMLGVDAGYFEQGSEGSPHRLSEASHDALKELLNVVCGNILTEVAGEKPVFNLSIPVASDIHEDEWEDLPRQSGAVALVVEGSPICVCLVVDS